MLQVLARGAIAIAAGALWVAGLRLFLHSGLSRTRLWAWAAFLVLVGIGVGVVLPLGQLWSKFLLLLVILPLLGLADVFLFRSRRGLSFWVRACGFEVGTVFGVAAGSRLLLDLAGVTAWLRAGG